MRKTAPNVVFCEVLSAHHSQRSNLEVICLNPFVVILVNIGDGASGGYFALLCWCRHSRCSKTAPMRAMKITIISNIFSVYTINRGLPTCSIPLFTVSCFLLCPRLDHYKSPKHNTRCSFCDRSRYHFNLVCFLFFAKQQPKHKKQIGRSAFLVGQYIS